MGAHRVSAFFAACDDPARRYRLLPYYYALDLSRDHRLRRLVEKWWLATEGEAAAEARVTQWLDALALLPPPHRRPLASWLHQSGEIGQAIPAHLPEIWQAGAALHTPCDTAAYAASVSRELRRGCPAGLILDWLDLRREPGTYGAMPETGPHPTGFPIAHLRLLLAGLEPPRELGGYLQDAFRACLIWSGAEAFFLRPEWQSLTLDERCAVIDFALLAGHSAAVLLTELAAMEPSSRSAYVESVYWATRRNLRGAGPEVNRTFLRRWEGDSASLAELGHWVDEFPARLRLPLLSLPAAAMRQLAKAARGLGGCSRFGGARPLLELDPDRALAWLHASPAHFVETCVWLNALGAVRARRLLRQALRTPLFAPAAPGSLVRLDNLLTQHRTLASRLPEFAPWDKHFSGAKVLRPVSVDAFAQRLTAQLRLLQMWWLQAECKRELACHQEDHALLFRAMLEENRRPLSRFLRAHAAHNDTRLDHPANRNWLARRGAGFQLAAWFDPPVVQEDAVTLAVERDPLEILKIGTYVGSCLALGGVNAHATVAILLDANKRVIFARNRRGGFVARQVVGISEDGKLVCYSVYPQNTPPALEDAFERYVMSWAARLGLPLAKGAADREASQKVRPLTVNSWYDDGLWSRFDTA